MGLSDLLQDDGLDPAVRAAIERELTERRIVEARLSLHQELALGLLSAGSLGEALDLAIAAAQRLEAVDAVGVYVLSQDGGSIELVRQSGLSPDVAAAVRVLGSGDGLFAQAARCREAFLDADATARAAPEGRRKERFRSSAALALSYSGAVVGSLNVGSRTHEPIPEAIRPDLRMIATLLGNSVARFRAADAAEATETENAALVASAPDAIFTVGPDGRFRSANPAATAALGVSPSELIGRSMFEVFPQAVAERQWRAIAEVFESGKGAENLRAPTETAGQTRWYDTRLTPVMEASGRTRYVLGIARDVTEQKKAEEALRESEARDRTLVAAIPDAVVLVDREGRYLSANPAASGGVGLTPEEMRGRFLGDFLSGEIATIWAERLESIFRNRRAASYLDVSRSTRRRWFLSTLAPVVAADGEVEAVLGISREVTDQKLAEEALRASEERYRALIESAPDAIFTFDVDGRLLSANAAAAAMVGLTPDRVQGTIVHDIFAPEAADERLERMRRVVRTGEAIRCEEEGAAPGNEGLWFQTTFAPVIDADGTAQCVLVIAREMTEQREAQAALAESQARYEMAAGAARVGFWDHTVGTGVMHIDSALRAILGYQREETPANSGWLRLIQDEDRERAFEAVRDCIRDHTRNFDLHVRALHKDGRPRWLHVRGSVVEEGNSGRPRLVGTAMDVTEQHAAAEETQRLQERLARAQKLESLGLFAGGFAHDLRSLVAALMSAADVAIGEVEEDSSARQPMAQVVDIARRAAELADQVLAYAGAGDLAATPMDVSRVTSETVALIRPTVPAGVRLDLDLVADLPPVSGDATQLGQVVLNLLSNAIDAIGPEGGTISARTLARDVGEKAIARLRVPTELSPGRCVVIEVTDTGCGMDAETEARVIDPFYSTKPGGRGLGLAASFGIVRAHGGAIDIESEVGRGTTVRVLLPVDRPDANGRMEPSPAIIEGGKLSGTVLLADDEPMIRWAGRLELEEAGLEVVTARDGAEAVSCFGEGGIDVVILDVTMPKVTGHQALEEIRKRDPDVPVILMSGLQEHRALARTDGLRRVVFVPKPYPRGGLAAAVRGLLHASRDVGD